MKSPFTGKEMSVVKEWRTMPFRKDEFRILFHVWRCEDTGEQFEDETFAELNHNQVVNQFRVKNAIPFPEQISSIRNQYGVSATKMSEIMGFGTNVYRQYEAGEVPNQSNAKLIQLVEDPHEFRKLVDISTTLEEKNKQKLFNQIEHLIEERKKNKQARMLENYLIGDGIPTALTGYRKTNFQKFTEMVVFFAENLKPWKTKMNKLLFYADFEMFRQTGFSISGIKYRAIPMGPVPENFNSIFEYLANRDEIDIYYTEFENGTGEQFKPRQGRAFDVELFSKQEMSVLNQIAQRFQNIGTSEIIEFSHREKAWIENQESKKLINYQYGFELQNY
ncbi:MAG TPA: DUF4065 domain-containing protein [Bacteroidales bacterium]|nr:DUF4065 domain-containing protein [Bacteroidales bacterium]HRX97388.1 DUF4065 domain-containing protein [Bacteroidales bacterium]